MLTNFQKTRHTSACGQHASGFNNRTMYVSSMIILLIKILFQICKSVFSLDITARIREKDQITGSYSLQARLRSIHDFTYSLKCFYQNGKSYNHTLTIFVSRNEY